MEDQQARKQDLLKEIDLIQGIITRMANTSSLIKGWTITLISIIFAYKSDTSAIDFIIIPILTFWFLDAYFLQHERIYRQLYNWVIEHRLQDDSYLFSLNPAQFNIHKQSIIRVMFSLTLGFFYGMTLFLTLIYLLPRLVL